MLGRERDSDGEEQVVCMVRDKLMQASCGSARERKLRQHVKWTHVREWLSRERDNECGERGENAVRCARANHYNVFDFTLLSAHGAQPEIGFSNIHVRANFTEGKRSPQWEC